MELVVFFSSRIMLLEAISAAFFVVVVGVVQDVVVAVGSVVVAVVDVEIGFRRNWEIKMEKLSIYNNNQQQIMVSFHFDYCC